MEHSECLILVRLLNQENIWQTARIKGNIIIKSFNNSEDIVNYYCEIANNLIELYKFKLVIILGISLVNVQSK